MITARSLAAVLCCLAVSSVSATTEKTVDSEITRVTVFLYGAMITREASVDLAAGDTTLIFPGLPNKLKIEGLQLETDQPTVRIGKVDLKDQQARNELDQEIAGLKAELQFKQNEIAVVDDSTRSADLQIKFLQSLSEGYAKEAWIGSAQANANISGWQQALGLLRSGSSEAYAIKRKNQAVRHELQKDVSLLKRKLGQVQGGRLSSKQILLAVRSRQAIRANFTVRYFQENANWEPQYEARLNSDTGALVLSQKVVVEQGTDEDWKSVELTLSTSQPSEELGTSEVYSQFLDIAPPARKRMESFASAPTASGDLEEIVVTATKRENAWTGSYALNHQIPGLVSINNNSDQLQSFEVEKFTFNSKLVTQVVPQQSTQAFLAARFTHDGQIPLYGSSAMVYVDGVFMGNIDMPVILPGSENTLPMGQDRRIEVKIKDQGGKNKDTGLTRKVRVEATDLLYEITNRRSEPTLVEVTDVYPVTRHKNIKVAVPRHATPPDTSDLDDRPGVIQWRKQLQANEAWQIRHAYTVTYPAGAIIRRWAENY